MCGRYYRKSDKQKIAEAFRLVSTLALLLATAARAQTAPLDLEQPVAYKHFLPPFTELHIPASEAADLIKQGRLHAMEYQGLPFQIVVSPQGIVESAEPLTPNMPHLEEARAIEMARTFKPWYHDGVPTRVRFKDDVAVLTADERWMEPRMPFPEVPDPAKVKITLTRTFCYGTCPAYTVIITGDGTVTFHTTMIGTRSIGVLVPGDHTAHIPAAAVQALLQKFRDANFFSALNTYSVNTPNRIVTDLPTHTMSLDVGPQVKTVVGYGDLEAGMPMAINNLEYEIDKTADTARWTSIDSNTLPVLIAEHWNFAAATPQNTAIYNAAIESEITPLINRLLAARASILTDNGLNTPLCTATAIGDLNLVSRMLTQVKDDVPLAVREQCLAEAAAQDSLIALRFWIDHGANPAAPTTYVGRTTVSSPLLRAITAHHPDIVRELLKYKPDVNDNSISRTALLELVGSESMGDNSPAILEIMQLLIQAGADVNARSGMGNGSTSIFAAAVYKDQLDLLLRSGADINARANYGDTALIRDAWSEAAVRNLLADGADPTVVMRGYPPKTALSEAQRNHCTACAALIQAALDHRASPTQ